MKTTRKRGSFFLKTIFLQLIISALSNFGLTQEEAIEVTDQTIKIGIASTEELFFSFAAGDEIIFNFTEQKGKTLKEIEIKELPESSKFSNFKVNSIENKHIKVRKNGVYCFSFKNGAMTPRVAKIIIERIPSSPELIDFSTDVIWKTVYDTTFIPYKEDSLIGYDTLRFKEEVKELISTETFDESVMDKSEKVHSYLNSNSSYTYVPVNLPVNKIEDLREEKTIAWAYWIGVGDESRRAFAQNVEAFGNLSEGLASAFISPLAGLAVGAIATLITPKSGEDVSYYFIEDYANISQFLRGESFLQFNKGKGIAAYGKYNQSLNQSFYIGLHNDNNTIGIDVNIKIVVVREVKTFDNITYDREKITPRYVTLDKVRYDIKPRKIRVAAE